MIVETARVYRVGRRRFLSRNGAFSYMARQRVAMLRPCECEPAEYDHHQTGTYLGCTYPGSTCDRHERQDHWREVTRRYERLLRRAWRNGWRPEGHAERLRAPDAREYKQPFERRRAQARRMASWREQLLADGKCPRGDHPTDRARRMCSACLGRYREYKKARKAS